MSGVKKRDYTMDDDFLTANTARDENGNPIKRIDAKISCSDASICHAFTQAIEAKLRAPAVTEAVMESFLKKTKLDGIEKGSDIWNEIQNDYGLNDFLSNCTTLEMMALCVVQFGECDDLGEMKPCVAPRPIDCITKAEIYTVILARLGKRKEFLACLPQIAAQDNHIEAVKTFAPHYTEMCGWLRVPSIN